MAHSLSPALHRAAYAALGLDWRYDAYEVDAAGLADFVLGRTPDWVGLSLTMPLKEAALELADDVDPLAARVGAANTLLLGERRRAANTDVGGLRAVLEARALDAPRPVTVLGGGATARSALVALDGVAADVVVLARDPGRVGDLGPLELSYTVRVLALSDAAARHEALGRPLVLNTTPAGTLDALAAEVSAVAGGQPASTRQGSGRGGSSRGLVSAPARAATRPASDATGWGGYVDVVYDPWPTPLAVAYRAAGREIAGGLEMLVQQAALQVEAMTGLPAPLDAMWAAVRSPAAGPAPTRANATASTEDDPADDVETGPRT